MSPFAHLVNRAGAIGNRLRFDRNEISGAFGDLGTSLPLLAGMILASGLNGGTVLIVFGLLLIGTGLYYGLPMPVQPLKMVAVLVIAQNIQGPVLLGAGLAIGLLMLLLTATGAVGWIARAVPEAVIRGIQFGLGLQLARLALFRYIPSEGARGWALAAAGLAVALPLLGNRKYPPTLFVIGLGAAYAALFTAGFPAFSHSPGLTLPRFSLPSGSDMWVGLFLLAIPQVPLSIGNSILATHRIGRDYFPDRAPGLERIGFTYGVMNLAAALFGGVPVCHGSGGMAGHHALGGRTGGSVVIYGSLILGAGLLCSGNFAAFAWFFPLPILGVLLLVEGLALMKLMRGVLHSPFELALAEGVGLCAAFLPYGYLIGLTAGTAAYHLAGRAGRDFLTMAPRPKRSTTVFQGSDPQREPEVTSAPGPAVPSPPWLEAVIRK